MIKLPKESIHSWPITRHNIFPISYVHNVPIDRCAFLYALCSGPFWLNRAGLLLVVLGPNILSKGVETGPTVTQFGPACAQTIPCLPGAHLRQVELFQMSCGRKI